jgi:hypothetical protein
MSTQALAVSVRLKRSTAHKRESTWDTGYEYISFINHLPS